jgi:hypothetical protein
MTAIVGTEVVTALRKDQPYPAVRIEQFADRLVTTTPRWLVATSLQVSAYGGPKAQAWQAAETARALLVDRFVGAHTYPGGLTGTITHVAASGARDIPDDTFAPARPRWIFTATVFAHP